MAEGDFQDKTEKPTGKKRSDARKKGQVAKSREVSSVAVLLAGLSTLYLFGPFMYGHIRSVMRKSFSMVSHPTLDLSGVLVLSQDVVESFIIIVAPVMAAGVVRWKIVHHVFPEGPAKQDILRKLLDQY